MIEQMSPCQQQIGGTVCGCKDFSITEVGRDLYSVARCIRCNKCGVQRSFKIDLKEFIEDALIAGWNAENVPA